MWEYFTEVEPVPETWMSCLVVLMITGRNEEDERVLRYREWFRGARLDEVQRDAVAHAEWLLADDGRLLGRRPWPGRVEREFRTKGVDQLMERHRIFATDTDETYTTRSVNLVPSSGQRVVNTSTTEPRPRPTCLVLEADAYEEALADWALGLRNKPPLSVRQVLVLFYTRNPNASVADGLAYVREVLPDSTTNANSVAVMRSDLRRRGKIPSSLYAPRPRYKWNIPAKDLPHNPNPDIPPSVARWTAPDADEWHPTPTVTSAKRGIEDPVKLDESKFTGRLPKITECVLRYYQAVPDASATTVAEFVRANVPGSTTNADSVSSLRSKLRTRGLLPKK
jgi:hypothetical protein